MATVCSTLGSSTITGWKRRSSAASDSMYLRYSSNVVAPTHCSSPRASSGLIIDERSSEPSAAPAPTSVCSSSMNRMTSRALRLTSSRIRFTRLSNSPRYFVPATSGPSDSASTRLFAQRRWDAPRYNTLREAFHDRRLADAGFADEHRVVLAAPRKNRDDAFDLVVATDDRIEFAAAREVGKVARKILQCRRAASDIEALRELVAIFDKHRPARNQARGGEGCPQKRKRAGCRAPLRAIRAQSASADDGRRRAPSARLASGGRHAFLYSRRRGFVSAARAGPGRQR